VTVDTFKHEIADAVKAYDKFVVCIDKTPEDCEASLRSLMEKAIKAYENRGAHLRHGIALDRQVTIINTDGSGAHSISTPGLHAVPTWQARGVSQGG